MDNAQAVTDGLNKAREVIVKYMLLRLEKACDNLIADALARREFEGFTGNTQTSYACGIYHNGVLQSMVIAEDNMKPPVRIKVQKGAKIHLEKPYEGEARTTIGMVKVDESRFGAETAEDFLKSFKPSIKKGFSVAMTTGTEYSEYLENVRNLNVLTMTGRSSAEIILQELKPDS